jgi:thiamine kinase-like enzyme
MDIKNEICRLLPDLNLGEITIEPSRIMGGLLNRMYKVTTSKGTYAVKHLNPEVMKRVGAKNNHILAEKVANLAKQNGIPCVPALTIGEKALQEYNGNYYLIYDWFNGKALEDEEVEDYHIEKMAMALANLHNINYGELMKEYSQKDSCNSFDIDYYISNIENDKVRQLLINKKEELSLLYKTSEKYYDFATSNLIISHRDLDLKNVLWDEENNPVLIDWESAGLTNPLVELIDTAWNWSGGQNHFKLDRFKLFIDTYRDGNSLHGIKEAYYVNFKNKFGWLEYNLKRACRIECTDDEEQHLGESEIIRTIYEILKYKLYLEDYITSIND